MFGGDADEEGVRHILALIAGGNGGQAELLHLVEEFDGDLGGGGDLLFDGHGVLIAEGFAQAFLAGHGVGRAELEFIDPQGAGAKLLCHVDELFIEAGDDAGDGDDGSGADEYAEHGEEGAELMGADGVQRQEQVLADVLAVGGRHGG